MAEGPGGQARIDRFDQTIEGFPLVPNLRSSRASLVFSIEPEYNSLNLRATNAAQRGIFRSFSTMTVKPSQVRDITPIRNSILNNMSNTGPMIFLSDNQVNQILGTEI